MAATPDVSNIAPSLPEVYVEGQRYFGFAKGLRGKT
jgi:hypothetical protein